MGMSRLIWRFLMLYCLEIILQVNTAEGKQCGSDFNKLVYNVCGSHKRQAQGEPIGAVMIDDETLAKEIANMKYRLRRGGGGSFGGGSSGGGTWGRMVADSQANQDMEQRGKEYVMQQKRNADSSFWEANSKRNNFWRGLPDFESALSRRAVGNVPFLEQVNRRNLPNFWSPEQRKRDVADLCCAMKCDEQIIINLGLCYN